MTSVQKCFHGRRHRRGRQPPQPDLLRDARQLLDRRLLQGVDHPLGLGVCDRVAPARPRRCTSRSTRPTTRPARSGSRRVPAERISDLGQLVGTAQRRGAVRPGPEPLLRLGPGDRVRRADVRPGCECDRYLEFWNLVFMQFYQDRKGTGRRRRQGERHRPAWSGSRRSCSRSPSTRPTCSARSSTPSRRSRTAFWRGRGPRLRPASSRGPRARRHLPGRRRRGPRQRGSRLRHAPIVRRAVRYARKLGIRGRSWRAWSAGHRPRAEPYPELRLRRDGIVETLVLEESRFADTLALAPSA